MTATFSEIAAACHPFNSGTELLLHVLTPHQRRRCLKTGSHRRSMCQVGVRRPCLPIDGGAFDGEIQVAAGAVQAADIGSVGLYAQPRIVWQPRLHDVIQLPQDLPSVLGILFSGGLLLQHAAATVGSGPQQGWQG